MNMKCEKEIRGDVLRILKTAFPMGLTAGCLCKTINKAGWNIDSEYLQVQCAYLEQKGYIKADKCGQEEFGTQKVIYTITANGIDLIEGNITDTGVVTDV